MSTERNEFLEDAKAVRNYLSKHKVVAEEGYFQLKVSSVHELAEEGKSIINFEAFTKYGMNKAGEHLAEGELQEALNSTMSANARDGIDFCPDKGDRVRVYVTTITNKEGIDILVIDSVAPLKEKVAKTANFSLVEEKAEANPKAKA